MALSHPAKLPHLQAPPSPSTAGAAWAGGLGLPCGQVAGKDRKESCFVGLDSAVGQERAEE